MYFVTFVGLTRYLYSILYILKREQLVGGLQIPAVLSM